MKIKQKKKTVDLASLHAALVASLSPEEVAKRAAIEQVEEELAAKQAAEEAEKAAAAKEASLEAYLARRREREAAKAALAAEIAAANAARSEEIQRAASEEATLFTIIKAEHGSSFVCCVQRRLDAPENGTEGIFILRNGKVMKPLRGKSNTAYWISQDGDVVVQTNNNSPRIFREVCKYLPPDMPIKEACQIYQDTCTKAGYTELYQHEVNVGEIHARLASEAESKRAMQERDERRKNDAGAIWRDGRYESEWYGDWG